MKTPLVSKEKQKELSPKFKQLLLDEHMFNGPAAEILHLKRDYMNFMLNSKYFDKAPAWAWKRVQDLVESGLSITAFGETLKDEHSPESAIPDPPKTVNESEMIKKAEEVIKKQAPEKPTPEKKSLKILLNQAEIKEIKEGIRDLWVILKKQDEVIKERNRFFMQEIEEIRRENEMLQKCYSNLLARVETIDQAAGALLDKRAETKSLIVIFQRNSYSKS